MTTHPTLYKKTSVGKIQAWTISVDGNTITTVFGQVDGKLQTTQDVVKEGKNAGKANATTPEQQAEAEALAKWTKQKKKGYVETIDDAQDGKRDAVITGGIDPMLAHKYTERKHKIKYPAYSQPKLDGIRCIAVLSDGVCTLWTRTRKPITGVPHIQREIERLFAGDIVFDGELYCHALKQDFEKIVHYVRQEEPAEGHEVVEYHVYDLACEGPFSERYDNLASLLGTCNAGPLKALRTDKVESEEQLMERFGEYLGDGYEGAMVRNADGVYAGKRSVDLQKVKEFQDDEFPIVGVTEGRGKLSGHAIFVCEAKNGNRFEAKLRGDTAALKAYWENSALWEGKKLTVRFQGYTNTNEVPRFPVGVAVRDYE